MGEAAGTVASAFVSPPAAQQISDTVSRHGSAGLQHASSAVGHVAQLALNSSNQQRPTSFLWGAALNATVFASKIVSSHLENGRRRLDARHDYSFARQFDMDAERVETVLNEGPKELFLSGRVWHLCRRFTDPTGVTMARSRVVQADRDQFKDVEVSGWMVYDHHPYVMLQCLERMLCDD